MFWGDGEDVFTGRWRDRRGDVGVFCGEWLNMGWWELRRWVLEFFLRGRLRFSRRYGEKKS